LKNLLLSALLTLSSLLLCLAVGELAARLLLPPHPLYREPQPLHDPDPRLRWVLRPSQDGFTQDRAMHVNAAGLRDSEELPVPKPAGELRVLVLGDSFSFGNGVADRDTYAEVLERELRARGLAARVLNAGVQGYDVHQEADWLRERGLALEPDAVVVGLYENDLVRRKDGAREAPIAEDGGLRKGAVRELVPDAWIYAVKRLRSVAFLGLALRELRWRWFPPPGNYHAKALFFGESSPAWEAALADVRDSLTGIRDASAARAGRPIVAVFPHHGQMQPGILDRTYHDPAVALVAEAGLEAVDLLPVFRAAVAQGEDPFIAFDGHPNELGHRLAGEALAEPVARALRGPASPPPVH
jgi:lysophospholipase L1-like esterase